MITIHHLIIKESIQFVHEILFNEGPRIIFEMYTYSISKKDNICSIRKPMISKKHKSENFLSHYFIGPYISITYLTMKSNYLTRKNCLSTYKKNIQFIFTHNKIQKINRD